jgi:FlaG/FlaF family flagellin (archaellin)
MMPMSSDRWKNKNAGSCDGVSEIIGAIMLVSIVVLLIAVIAVFLYSQPTPHKIPNLNFMTGVSNSKTTLYLYHNGGDSLDVGEFSVLLDGVPKSYTVSGGGSQWSLGKNLVIPITSVPKSVQIVYNNTAASGGTGTTGAVLLDQASADVVSSVNVSADQAPYLDCSAVRNDLCGDQIPDSILISQYEKRTAAKRIAFMEHAQSRGTIIGGTTNHFNFTVSKPNSSINIADASAPNCDGGSHYPLTTGDKVGITFTPPPPAGSGNPDFFTVYGSAPQIWELTAGGASRIRTTITYANGTTVPFFGRTICHAYISEYSNLDSNLDVTTTTTGRVTALVVNESHIIEGPNSTVIKLVNVQPIGNGLFLITYGANTAPIYVIGWADQIQFNTIPQVGLGL